VSDVDLKREINGLIQMQAVDIQIYRLQQEKQNIPLKIKELEEAFTNRKEGLAQLEKKGLDLHKERKAKELDLKSKEEEAHKMQTQLYQLKTNNEYSAKLKEIDGVKADVSVLEDTIIVLLEQADKLKNEINNEKQLLAEEEKKKNDQKQKLDLRDKEIQDRLSQLHAQRKQIAQQINPEILAKYDKILINRDHLAIVKVDNNSCQGCFMNVPPQVINLIKMYDNLVICETCQRILFITEEGIGDLH
jgi:predicted  nucleic acid-binding Zn-ribbon protein